MGIHATAQTPHDLFIESPDRPPQAARVSGPMPLLILSQDDLERLGLSAFPEEVIKDVEKALLDHGLGATVSDKVALTPTREKMFARWNADSDMRERYADEDLDQKLSALNCFNRAFASVKLVGGSVLNREMNLPRSESLIVLYESDTIRPVAMMRGTEISALRTGAYAAIVGDYLMPKERDNVVAYIGSGKMAETSLVCMDASIAERIREIRIYSRTPSNKERFVSEMQGKTSIPLVSSLTVDDAVGDADYVITATTALNPVVEDYQLKKNVTVLLLGGDEVGPGFIRRAHDHGLLVCDDWGLVKHRDVQSLSYFYKDAKEGRYPGFDMDEGRIIDLWNIIVGNISGQSPECVYVNCVGLPDLDLQVAHRMYSKAIQRDVGTRINL